jgi:hypothetical protein
MKYFKIEFQTTVDAQGNETVTPLVSEGTDKDDAITNWCTSFGALRASVDAGTLVEATCMVINSKGGVDTDHCESYAGKVEPEPEPNE